MGNRQAMAMAGTDTSIEVQISWHLSSNHYPPVASDMVGPCIEAIEHYNAGDLEAMVTLPEGTTYKNEQTAPTLAIIEAHHLGAWLEEAL